MTYLSEDPNDSKRTFTSCNDTKLHNLVKFIYLSINISFSFLFIDIFNYNRDLVMFLLSVILPLLYRVKKKEEEKQNISHDYV